MNIKNLFIKVENNESQKQVEEWCDFLEAKKFDSSFISKIDMSQNVPVIYDLNGNKFSIDFVNNKQNYSKKKASLKSELISKALGAGKYGMKVLDLSAGLGIDAIFLAQLGYSVTALERNPLIYLALSEAAEQISDLELKFQFGDALKFLKEEKFDADVIYFDPMFPEKAKSALPRQEMVFFRNLVGSDEDAAEVLAAALSISAIKRVAVKRPIKAPALMKPQSSILGKLIRFDLYTGVKKS